MFIVVVNYRKNTLIIYVIQIFDLNLFMLKCIVRLQIQKKTSIFVVIYK